MVEKTRSETPGSYVVNAALACAVLYYAQDLSRSGRTAIDWIVMGLVVLAILWNLFKLGQRLYRCGGASALSHLLNTLMLWVFGLANTLWLPTYAGAWRHVVGWLFIAGAALYTVYLWKAEQKAKRYPRREK